MHRDALGNKPVSIYLRTSREVDEILLSTGLEFTKRGYGDYVV